MKLQLTLREDFADPTAVRAGQRDRVELGERNPGEFGGEFSARDGGGVDGFGDLEACDRAAPGGEKVGGA